MKQKAFINWINTKRIIGNVLVVVLSILVLTSVANIDTTLAVREATEAEKQDEMTLVKTAAVISKGRDSNDQVNKDTLAEELDKYYIYSGGGKAEVTEKSETTLLVTFTETGDEYLIAIDGGLGMHQHEGQSGLSYANGCYTIAQQNGGSCGGHEVATSFKCGWCGTVVQGTSKPSSCPNNVCGSGTSGQKWNTNTTKTTYHSSSSGCSKWTWKYVYVLGCGWE